MYGLYAKKSHFATSRIHPNSIGSLHRVDLSFSASFRWTWQSFANGRFLTAMFVRRQTLRRPLSLLVLLYNRSTSHTLEDAPKSSVSPKTLHGIVTYLTVVLIHPPRNVANESGHSSTSHLILPELWPDVSCKRSSIHAYSSYANLSSSHVYSLAFPGLAGLESSS